MNILYVITRSEPGGAQTHLLDLLCAFGQRVQVELATGEEGFLVEAAREQDIPVHHIPTLIQPLSPTKDAAAVAALARLLKRVRPDLVHLHSSKAGVVGRLAARVAGVPSVFTAHGWAFTEGVSGTRARVALASERTVTPLGQRVIAVSDYDRLLARRHAVGREDQIVTVHNGIADAPSVGMAPPHPVLRVVMVARFSSQKDHATLLGAVARVPNLHLSLIGDGELLPQARTLAERLGIARRVDFLGTRSDVPQVLAGHHVFTLISHYEGFPISILEAMRAGLPVVASDVGGVREAVVDGVNGCLIPRGDVAALAAALEALADDPEKRTRMGAAGRRRFLNHFTLQGMIDKTWAVYEEVLAQAPRRPLERENLLRS